MRTLYRTLGARIHLDRWWPIRALGAGARSPSRTLRFSIHKRNLLKGRLESQPNNDQLRLLLPEPFGWLGLTKVYSGVVPVAIGRTREAQRAPAKIKTASLRRTDHLTRQLHSGSEPSVAIPPHRIRICARSHSMLSQVSAGVPNKYAQTSCA
jgi:hypothetical protein